MNHLYTILLSLILSMMPHCAFGQQNKTTWENTFSKKGVGLLRLGDDLTTAITRLEDHFVMEVDSIPVGLFNNGKYEQVYVARDQNNQVILRFTLSETTNAINCIELFCESYTSAKGLRVGWTIKDLKAKYKKLKVNYFYESGLYIYPGKTNYGLRLNTSSFKEAEHTPYDWVEATPESLPDGLVIDMIAIVDKKADAKRRKKRLRRKD